MPPRVAPLGFRDRRSLLTAALGRGRNNPITAADGIGVDVRIRLNAREEAFALTDSRTRAEWNKMVRNLGALIVRDAQAYTRELDTIDTRLFISSWRAQQVGDFAQALKGASFLALTNDAPYAGYVHPKGRRVLVRQLMPRKFAGKWKRDAKAAVDLLKPRIAQWLKNRILAQQKRSGRPGPMAAK